MGGECVWSEAVEEVCVNFFLWFCLVGMRDRGLDLQDGKVGEVVDVGTEICLCTTTLLPLIFKCFTRGTGYFHWGEKVCYLETCG